jgi:hypothetical protein
MSDRAAQRLARAADAPGQDAGERGETADLDRDDAERREWSSVSRRRDAKEVDERERAADERDRAADARDAAAQRRDWAADARDREADARERAADERDRTADERERTADDRERTTDDRERVYLVGREEQAEIDREVRASARAIEDSDARSR